MTSARGRGISLSENNDSVMSISWFDMFSFAASVLTTVTAAFESPGRASTEGLPDVYLEVQHPCWSCNSNSSSANASAGVR